MKPGRINPQAEACRRTGRLGQGGENAPAELLESVPAILQAIAHDLSQPLTACRGTLELALLKGSTLSDYRKASEKALAAAEAMVAVVQFVRELAEAFVPPGEIAPVELGVLVRQVVEDLAPIAESRGVTVNLEKVPRTIVMTDGEKIYHAILNALHDVINHGPEPKEVLVSLSTSPEMACLTIREEGRNNSEVETGRRLGTLSAGPGISGASPIGIGAMLVAKKAIEASGGSLTVEDAGAGGCRFHIRIPLALKNAM